VPATIDETNSAVCWGQPGTSDVFASALWSLDYTLRLAHEGLASVEFQGRIAGCAPYSPLCTGRHGAALFARPDFYSLMAVQQLPPGPFLQLSDPDAGKLDAYAIRAAPGGALSVVLDNLGDRLWWPCTGSAGLPADSVTIPVAADTAVIVRIQQPLIRDDVLLGFAAASGLSNCDWFEVCSELLQPEAHPALDRAAG
jgi:hypothetical protein